MGIVDNQYRGDLGVVSPIVYSIILETVPKKIGNRQTQIVVKASRNEMAVLNLRLSGEPFTSIYTEFVDSFTDEALLTFTVNNDQRYNLYGTDSMSAFGDITPMHTNILWEHILDEVVVWKKNYPVLMQAPVPLVNYLYVVPVEGDKGNPRLNKECVLRMP
jgi:hypothetical protein